MTLKILIVTRVVFNSDYNWKIADLKKKFLKSAKEREKLQTMFIMEGETDERTDDQKSSSTLFEW